MLSALIKALFHNQNQFASGGLLLMVIGGIAAYLRSIPLQIWKWCKRQTTMSMTITDNSAAFSWFKWWFQTHPKCGKIRQVDAYTPYSSGETRALLGPAPGHHWVWYKKRPIWIEFTRTVEKQVFGSSRTESFTITTVGRDQQFLRDLLQSLCETHKELTKDKPRLHVCGRENWEEVEDYFPRTLDSVILPSTVKERLTKDVADFLAGKDWYIQQGIPYRRGYLLYGLPGTGKTSLIQGIANHFGFNVYIVNLNEVNDDRLAAAMRKIETRSIVLLEDIDCTNSRKHASEAKGKEISGASLSGVLNVIDGAQSPQNVVFFMTTNHAEKLDEALVRAGRCDVKIEFREATHAQKSEFYSRIFPQDTPAEREAFIIAHPAQTIASFQDSILSERNARLNSSVARAMAAD
jgi:mitochondrial chaperone BCS1